MLKIYRPLKYTFITQKFGENNACIQTNKNGQAFLPYRMRFTGTGICPVGYKNFYKDELGVQGHTGLDMNAWHGAPIYFNMDENTEWRVWNEVDINGGKGVTVYSKSPVRLRDNQIAYVRARYWHLLDSVIADEQPVKFGQLLAYADNTGASSGTHLHFDLKLTNEGGDTLSRDNGYHGAIDPMPWYEDTFVLNTLRVKQDALRAIDLARITIMQVQRYLKSIMK